MANNQLAQVAKINERLNEFGKPLGITAIQTTDGSGATTFSVNFNPSAFYSGFLSENIGRIKSVFEPIQPVIKFLTTEVPVVSSLADKVPAVLSTLDQDSDSKISVLDVLTYVVELKTGKQINLELISDVLSLSQSTSTFPSGIESKSIGSLTVDATGNITLNPKQIVGFQLPDLPSEFKVELLRDPVNSIFNILQNKPVSIFEYTAPKLTFPEVEIAPIQFPIIAVAGGVVIPGFQASMQFGFGFDTAGIQSGNFEDGFYITDLPGDEVQFSGSAKIGVFGGIPSGVASLDVFLDVGPNIGFTFKNDLVKEGRIRFSAIDFSKIDSIFEPNLALSAGIGGRITILGASVFGVETDKISVDLKDGGFPPAQIEEQVDKVLGYVQQIQDMKDGKDVSRLLKEAPGKPIEFVRDKADQFGNWTREKADQFGGFVEEQYEKGEEEFKKVRSRAWRTLQNGAEEFKEGGETLLREGEKLTKIVIDGGRKTWETLTDGTERFTDFVVDKGTTTLLRKGGKITRIAADGAETIWENTKDGLKVVHKKGNQAIEWVGGTLTKGEEFLEDLGGFLGFGLTDGGSSNSAPPKPSIPPKPSFPTKPDAGITYKNDGGILLQTGSGADVLEGTDADDEIRAEDGNDYVAGNGGKDFLYGEGGNDVLDGGSNNDALHGGSGDDTLKGGLNDDGLFGEAGNDNLFGGAGIDVLNGGSGSDTLKGGDDNDFLLGLDGDDNLDGEQGDDQLFGQDNNDQLFSSTGFDLLDGGANIDTARYDNDPGFVIVNIDETQGYSNTTSSFDLEPTFDVAAGKAWDGFGDVDSLRNLENITGSAYDDVLIGNALQNTLSGLAGNDLLIGNGGDDILDGGDGIDTVSYRRSVNSSNIGVSVDLSNNTAFDAIDGIDTVRNIENVIGSQFADRLTGNDQANTILGGDGNDIVDGKEGSDRLFGENGNDEISGGSGDDTLIGGTGSGWTSDILDGGFGSDTASYITATSGVAASLIAKTGWLGDATGDKFISIENLEGSSHNDFLIGDDGNNVLTGLDGDDTLQGEGGDDQLLGGRGNDTLRGGYGNDQLLGGDSNDILEGDEGDDALDGGTGDNILNAGEGNNSIVAVNGNNTVYAGAGTDLITLGNGNNTVYAGEGRSSITLGDGNNKVYGGANIDIIFVGNGNNEIYAGEGENTITSGSGNDLIYGGSLADTIYAGAGDNRIFAGEGKNIVVTQDGNDTIYTGSGRDFISTGDGDDIIYASEGDNLIYGGTGNNTIYSGSGRDLFILNAGVGFDTIKNFEIGKDKLGLVERLQPDQLAISQVNSGSTFFTQISIAESGDILARLDWTQASQLTGNSFMPNLSSSNSSLLSMFG